MSTTACRICQRVNPGDALYCYHDGVALDSAGPRGPLAVGSQPFPAPFVFASGRSCRNFDEMVLACENDWDDAKDALKEGYLEGFFGSLGRLDLARTASQAAKALDGDLGLDELLNKLPNNVRTPTKLQVQPIEMNLGHMARDAQRAFDVHLENQGMGVLHGSVSCPGAPWLSFGESAGGTQKLFSCRHELELKVHVVGKALRAGAQPLKAKLIVETNGGATEIPVTVQVPITPFPQGVLAGAKTPRQVAEKAKAAPRDAAVLFANGAVAAWYESNGWTYPVQGPAATGLGAVQQFFEALGLVAAPRVEINTQKLEMRGKPGAALEQVLEVQTVEKRPVFAHAVASAPWLQVGRVMLDGRKARIPVRVAAVPSLPGETLSGNVEVTANGNQRFRVAVSLAIAGKPGSSNVQVLQFEEPAPLPLMELVELPPEPTAVQPYPTAIEKPKPKSTPIVQAPARPTRRPRLDDEDDEIVSTRRHRRRAGFNWTAALPVLFLIVGLGLTLVRDLVAYSKRGQTDTKRLEELEEAQKRINDATKRAQPGALAKLSKEQKELADKAERTARDLGVEGARAVNNALGHMQLAEKSLAEGNQVMALREQQLALEELRQLGTAAARSGDDDGDTIDIRFHDVSTPINLSTGGGGIKGAGGANATDIVAIWEPTMRFGVTYRGREGVKRLTYMEDGTSNNTCLLIEDNGKRRKEILFGEPTWRKESDKSEVDERMPGSWIKRSDPLPGGRKGMQSIWVSGPEDRIKVTQIVEVIEGAQSGRLDTCLVRYRLENADTTAHRVGLRFLLDTYIGSNDGAPFLIPGAKNLCTTLHDFKRPQEVPDFIQACEKEDLQHPGTIAHLQLRVGGGIQPPSRVTLGAYPDARLATRNRLCRQERTKWDVPLMSIQEIRKVNPESNGDSAVAMYWTPEALSPGDTRDVGFSYGLGGVTSKEGKLGITVGGDFSPGGEFTVTAYVVNPTDNQTVTLTLPDGFGLIGGRMTQSVPAIERGATSRRSAVSWKVRASKTEGDYTLKVDSSNGASQSQKVKIKARGIFGG